MQLNLEDNYINELEGFYYYLILNGVLSFYISLYLFLQFKPIFTARSILNDTILFFINFRFTMKSRFLRIIFLFSLSQRSIKIIYI